MVSGINGTQLTWLIAKQQTHAAGRELSVSVIAVQCNLDTTIGSGEADCIVI
jgi:hypothetical protein